MKVILITNSRFKKTLDLNLTQLHKLEYPTVSVKVADDVDFLNLKLGKPAAVLEELEKTPEGELLCYLDADAFIIKPIPEIESDTTADVFLTYHGSNQRIINSGVYFLRSNKESKRFMQQWCDIIEEGELHLPEHRQGDQAYLNVLIRTEYEVGWKLKNTIQDFNGIRIKFLDADIYNSKKAVCDKKILDNAKIIHIHVSTTDRYYWPDKAIIRRLKRMSNWTSTL